MCIQFAIIVAVVMPRPLLPTFFSASRYGAILDYIDISVNRLVVSVGRKLTGSCIPSFYVCVCDKCVSCLDILCCIGSRKSKISIR